MSFTPPHDPEAEKAVLGALLSGVNRNVVDDITDQLTGADFYRPHHETIYDTCVQMHQDSERVDAVLLADRLGPQTLQHIGGAPYLHTLVSSLPTGAHARHYATIVKEKAVARRLAEAGAQMQQTALESSSPSEAVEDARQTLDTISRGATPQTTGLTLSEALPDAVANLENPVAGMPSPWADIDRWTYGLHPGQLVVIGARPSHGKSVMATNLAAHASQQGYGTYLATLEMSRQEVVNRILSQRCRVNLSQLMSHQLSENDWNAVAARSGELHEWPLIIDDDGTPTLHQLRGRARSAARRVNLGVIVVDYLQLMRPRDPGVNREQQVAELSRGLKALAKELDVPVVALAQVNRNATHAPTMSDLRESGQIEADADQIWLLHRPDVYDPDERPGELDVHVAKNRNGPQGKVTLAFQGHYATAHQFAKG